ncbi:hypothetical protein QJS04_geneDACA018714 [Acorus gramineus]|uniref:Uncharacterized protein n=1 Tax=Acorus gramineus TaxID=55184 RepID=A0AAV9A3K2_ACOGR|nr:hypothetical protein QJS04_geneDACA018714 [Acorus gramineus]
MLEMWYPLLYLQKNFVAQIMVLLWMKERMALVEFQCLDDFPPTSPKLYLLEVDPRDLSVCTTNLLVPSS